MKKIVLASAFAFAAFAANAQSNTPSTVDRSEDVANLNITMTLHNWIDIDNENTDLISAEPNSWNDLNNGWNVGSAPFNLSASRKCKISAVATSMREQTGGHAMNDQAGWSFGAQYLSLEAGQSSLGTIPQTVLGPGFSDNWIQDNNLASASDVYTSNQGMYLRRLNPTIGAFKHSAPGTYYTLNLNGGTYKGKVTFTATLN
jgi:hypothetical protein